MKKFLYSLILVIILCVSAHAEIQEFKFFSLNIPKGFEASEKILDNGTSIVAIVPEDENFSGAIAITTGSHGELSLEAIAAKYSLELGGTLPETDGEGMYFFSFNNGESHAMIIGDDNFYMLTTLTAINEDNNILLEILDSLELK